ncbi:MAG: hypothetical protein AAGE98_10270 [Actinomycetota bacterium]
MERARAAGRRLAERHAASAAAPDPQLTLVNHAESPRADDWTLRSALVRLASPEPQLVADLLTRVRRLDATLSQASSILAKQTVVCDRALTLDTVDGEPVDPYPDTRTADLARLAAASGDEADVVVEAYLAEVDLGAAEVAALPLLGVALTIDTLADELVGWARIAPAPAPTDRIRATIAAVQTRLDELGVPVEEPPMGRGRRRS